jgi:hypothetical protein
MRVRETRDTLIPDESGMFVNLPMTDKVSQKTANKALPLHLVDVSLFVCLFVCCCSFVLSTPIGQMPT